MIHILKTGCKNFRILEISSDKFHNSGTNLNKNMGFDDFDEIFASLLNKLRIKELSVKKL